MTDVLSAMLSIVRQRLNIAAAAWLDTARAPEIAGDVNRLCAAYTAASRHAGTSRLELSPAEQSDLTRLAPGLNFERWTVADAARAAILLSVAHADSRETFVDHALACFENGDAGEQQSWLKAISLMPASDQFTAVAVDSCRSHIQPLFEAIACENPYPAAHFSDHQFNQLVLKAMFTGVRLERIAGLARRLNADLSRMARDYAAERRAAGRTVPPDLPLALHDARELEEFVS